MLYRNNTIDADDSAPVPGTWCTTTQYSHQQVPGTKHTTPTTMTDGDIFFLSPPPSSTFFNSNPFPSPPQLYSPYSVCSLTPHFHHG